jgi:hypothetical protein
LKADYRASNYGCEQTQTFNDECALHGLKLESEKR